MEDKDMFDAFCAAEYSIGMEEVLRARSNARAMENRANIQRLRLRQNKPLYQKHINAIDSAREKAIEAHRYADDCESRLRETLSGKWDKWLNRR